MPVLTKLQKLYWLQLLAVLFLGGYFIFFANWKIETNLLSILPNAEQQQDFEAAEQALFKQKSQQLVVLLSGSNALAAYEELQTAIKQTKYVAELHTPEPALTDIANFYIPYRHNFLPAAYLDNIANGQMLSQLANTQLVQLANPFVSETIATAPRLNLAAYLQESLTKLSEVEFYQGVASLNVQGQRYLIMYLQLSLDGFELNASQVMATKLSQIFTRISRDFNVDVNYSGILFHTAESTAQAKNEISSFGVFSIVAVILLILVAFRSLLPLTAALVVLAIACTYGFVAILCFFDSFHLLTLVFAVTLVGVVVDYCFHAFVYASDKVSSIHQSGKSAIIKPLTLGFLTTALGYIVLIFSPLSLLSQVAVFMIFGLFGALITVLMLLPYLDRAVSLEKAPIILRFSQSGVTLLNRLQHYKLAIFIILFAPMTLLFLFKPMQFNDDVRLLNSSPDWLLAQEVKTAKVLNYQNSERVLVKANTIQDLLEKQEHIINQIQVSQPNIKIKGLHELLPSIKRQQQHFGLMSQANELGHFQGVLAITGLRDPISSFQPLNYDAFMKGPLAFIGQFYIAQYSIDSNLTTKNTEFASWLELTGERLSAENLRWLDENLNASLYDPARKVSAALSDYRQGVLVLLASAFVVVMFILMSRYGFKTGALSTIATVGSALLALVISQVISGHLNIFNLLAVLLIIALAIDYVIFYQEQGLQAKTFLAICLSALSSAAVFGILVFSATPAVSSFGLTVMIGIASTFILAPMSVLRHNNGLTD